MNWRKIAFAAYPVFIVAGIVFLMMRETRAGHVRQLEISPDQPGIVHLAFGRTTAISFSARPEKVVPGSPQAIEVNFLGKDITVRPLNAKAGNLLVYTRTSRFVILFEVGSEAQYDDVVKVAPSFSKAPLRLLVDSFRISSVQISIENGHKSLEIPIALSFDERSIESAEFKEALQPYPHLVCTDCLLKHEADSLRLSCQMPIHDVHCRSGQTKLAFRRGPHESLP
jgi:hypothetical protein